MTVQIAPNTARSPQIASVKRYVISGLSVIASLAVAFMSTVTSSKAVLSKLLEIPFTCIGLICINVGFFHIIHDWGWITTGISMIVLEAMIADKDDG